MGTEILAVVGSLLTGILGINAYFVKQLVDNIHETKTKVAVLISQNVHKDTELVKIRTDITELQNFNRQFSHRLLQLEILEKVKEMKNEDN